jgi:hypothetical protein
MWVRESVRTLKLFLACSRSKEAKNVANNFGKPNISDYDGYCIELLAHKHIAKSSSVKEWMPQRKAVAITCHFMLTSWVKENS